MVILVETQRARRARRLGWASGAALAAAALFVSGEASAQQPGQPPPPPPGFEQQPAAGQPPPPPGYGPPAGGYYTQTPPPQYGYAPPPGAMMGPKQMDYEEGDPVPPGYHVDTKVRKGLVISGSVTFGVLYLLSALTASVAQDVGGSDNYVPLFVPGVGPFITIGTANASGSGTFTLVIDGLAQTGGIAMTIIGIAMPESILVRNDVGAPSVHLAPVALGNGTMGVGLVGSM